MQRIIKIDVTANRARVSSRALGTQGEVAATLIALTFDSSWDGLAKKLIWSAPCGDETVYTLLSEPDGQGVYTAAVPALPLSRGGEASLTVEGSETDGDELLRRARSVELFFTVEPNSSTADLPAGSTPSSLAEQLWTAVNGKASAVHTHVKSDITDFAHTHGKSEITDFAHGHTKSDISDFAHTHGKSEITDFAHTHGKSEISDFAHGHTKSDISDFAHTHAKSEITNFAHTHPKSEITNFTHTHTKSDISDFTHTHADMLTKVSGAEAGDIAVFGADGSVADSGISPSDFAAADHTHPQSETGLTPHTHTKSEITDFTHTHAKADISDFAHTHTKSDISDFTHTHADMLTKVSGVESGGIPAFDSQGGLADSGLTASELIGAVEGMAEKTEIVALAYVGEAVNMETVLPAAQNVGSYAYSTLSNKLWRSEMNSWMQVAPSADNIYICGERWYRWDGSALREAAYAAASHGHTLSAADISYNDGGTTTNVQSALAAKGVTERSAQLLPNGWTGGSAPYTQTVGASGASPSKTVLVSVGSGATDAQFEAAVAACLRFTAGTNQITVKAYGTKPTVAVPLTVGVIS